VARAMRLCSSCATHLSPCTLQQPLRDKGTSSMNSLLCSPAALARRAKVVETIQPFRRTRPRVPFWHLAAHRIPTLWTLYRGLQKAAPTENVRVIYSLASIVRLNTP
jgi:hypothetical protein